MLETAMMLGELKEVTIKKTGELAYVLPCFSYDENRGVMRFNEIWLREDDLQQLKLDYRTYVPGSYNVSLYFNNRGKMAISKISGPNNDFQIAVKGKVLTPKI